MFPVSQVWHYKNECTEEKHHRNWKTKYFTSAEDIINVEHPQQKKSKYDRSNDFEDEDMVE